MQQFIPTTLGVALIEGYDGIGLETSLGKPFLRKEMEIKMKEICAGRKTRNDMVHETLEQYREAFVRTQQQVEVLKRVSLPLREIARPWMAKCVVIDPGISKVRIRQQSLKEIRITRLENKLRSTDRHLDGRNVD